MRPGVEPQYFCADGILLPPAPICIGATCVIPKLKDGQEAFTDGGCLPGQLLESGTECRVRCAHAYVAKGAWGAEVMTCRNGLLELPTLRCEIQDCPYLKSEQCFDWQYTCNSCCNTGLSVDGKSCWNGEYRAEDCCKNSAPTVAAAVEFLEGYSTTPGYCIKDTTCFDALYTCNDCCTTGKTAEGAECWDFYYTPDRCCASGNPNSDGTYPVVRFSSSEEMCARDMSCFDSDYVCVPCCTTGVSTSGKACWDHDYTQERCCNPNAVLPGPPSAVQFLSVGGPMPKAVDSRGHPLQTDRAPRGHSRGQVTLGASVPYDTDTSDHGDYLVIGIVAGVFTLGLAVLVRRRMKQHEYEHEQRDTISHFTKVQAAQCPQQLKRAASLAQPDSKPPQNEGKYKKRPLQKKYQVRPLDLAELEEP